MSRVMFIRRPQGARVAWRLAFQLGPALVFPVMLPVRFRNAGNCNSSSGAYLSNSG